MSTSQNKKDELTKELIAIKDAIDGIYKKELYEDEYMLPESKYIIKEPIIHLDVDKILVDLKNGCCEINNISKDNLEFMCKNKSISDHSKCIKCYSNYENGSLRNCIGYPRFYDKSDVIKFNFPIKIKLNNDEYIIKFYIINNNITDKTCIKEYKHIQKTQYMIYITNYARFIKSYEINFIPAIYAYKGMGMSDHHTYKLEYTKINGNIIYNNNNTIITNGAGGLCGYRHPGPYGCNVWGGCGQDEVMTLVIGGDQNKINLIEQPKLNYRMPKLFIDVIDAFYTENTDLMQECCKIYLEISRESKVKESIMLDIKIKNISDEKDKIIEQKDKIIQNKDTEIEKLNKQLEELQQKYDKIKSMFD